MSRRQEQKRIRYVRAVYNKDNKPKQSFQALVIQALTVLPNAGDTELVLSAGESLVVRQRLLDQGGAGTMLSIGLGVEGESMGTMGLGVTRAQDYDAPIKPNSGRAFRLADAFCLVDEDELLVCLDGGMHINKLEKYLRQLFAKANLLPESQSFGLIGRMDQDKAKTLDEEGVKAFKVCGSAYAASQQMQPRNVIARAWFDLKEAFRTAMEEEVDSEAERDALANHYADVNVSLMFSVKGGARGEQIVLENMEDAAKAVQEDAPSGAIVTLVTRKGNEVNADNLTLRTIKSVKRLSQQNGLDPADVWNKLVEYRQELVTSKRWKR